MTTGYPLLPSAIGRFELQGLKLEEIVMKIVVIGGSGLIGSKLVTQLRERETKR